MLIKTIPVVATTLCLVLAACERVSYDCRDYPCEPTSCAFIEIDCPDSAYYLDAGTDGGPGYNLDQAFDDCTSYEVDEGTSSGTEWNVKACARGTCFTEYDMSYYVCGV